MQHNEIKGFTDQSERNKALVNRNKDIEERVLRILDDLGMYQVVHPVMLEEGRKQIMQGFMWINRAIFQPERIALPEDEKDSETAPQAPPVHIGEVFRFPAEGEDVVRDAQGNDLIAQGPYWYRKAEWDAYATALVAYRDSVAKPA